MSRACLRRGRRGRSLDGSPAAPDSPSAHLSPLNRSAGQCRLDQSQRYGHQMTVLIRFLGNRLVA
jgi:hypothetical protein